MSQIPDLPKLEPVGVSDDGQRHYYDARSKQALIQACLQPGASLASLALKAGVNANLLRKWVRKHQAKCESGSAMPQTAEERAAFVPVVALGCAEAVACEPHETSMPAHAIQSSRLVAELPNGVVLTLECASHDGTLVTAMVETLGRSHVPLRR
ncbi:IS66-like element accessory protein TnpA [Paraburkholderia aromaticivorans]|uniref:Transposase n=1 Tax=Paraburkholderia aromaticivorans TaxID=2026199 RepID=A0A248VYN4_9BURK|nr:transposase [Paraburkholderia aromaticivorans]ASW04118.1 IS66 family insertion sequence hypothetical protein [Paraburkholderia aromaticivorans]